MSTGVIFRKWDEEDSSSEEPSLLFEEEEEEDPPPVVAMTPQRDVAHLVSLVAPLEVEANKVGIFNVFDEGGYKTLLLCTMFGLRVIQGRGDDAIDDLGHTFELKTINIKCRNGLVKSRLPDVSVSVRVCSALIERYRKTTSWVIGVFFGHTPVEVWQVPSVALEPLYKHWLTLVDKKGSDVNNPKVPFNMIRKKGTRVYRARR
jgi:hypothetical protein